MKYYIIAGEASGDLHGSNLIKEINSLDSAANIRAWGGDRMNDAGAHVVKHFKDHNYMGFVEVIIHIRKIMSNFKFCKSDILKFKPDVIILIDFPGFNLRIAKWAKQHNFQVVYYISPQIWAWKTSRVHTIRKVVDKIICILPFEKDFYKKFNVEAHYVGHPLLDAIPPSKHHTSETQKKIVTLLPGSRKQEISRMLPVMTKVAEKFPEFEFVVAGVTNINKEVYSKYSNNKLRVEYNKLYELMEQSQAAIVTSGTATLETALNNVPQVVCYKSTALSYHIAKKLIKVKYISLVNLIMDKLVVRELIQNDMNVDFISKELEKLLHSETERNRIIDDYVSLRSILGNSGASAKAAQIIFEQIG
jgi:lipid-A-disaccharide synthase